MAHMIPPVLRLETKSYAERKMFQLFAEQLDHSWTIFHSVAWQRPSLRQGAKDGELDFLIAHPKHGLLALEVKGGQIRYDGQAMQWWSNDSPIDDPFTQVCDSKHQLRRLLKDQPYWRKRWLSIGHAVAFPDSVVRLPMIRPDAPSTIILDMTQLTDLEGWLLEVFRYWQGEEQHSPLEAAGIEALLQVLGRSVNLRPLLGEVIPGEQVELLRATESQYRILDFLSRHRRASISGCAGSGKTLLAVEKARRLAAQGFEVLLTCYNKNLAFFLRESLSDVQGITVEHFHGLCARLGKEAGLSMRPQRPGDSAYFNTILPEFLVQASDALSWKVDAIIVDEGQDFQETWWLSLQCLLKEPDSGIFYIFYDDNQDLYNLMSKLPFDDVPYPLTESCRNTQRIHQFVQRYYRSDHATAANGPEGRDVELLECSSEKDLRDQLRKKLNSLVVEQRIPAHNIVVLTTKGREKSALWKGALGGLVYLVDQDTGANGEIFCTTVHQFKGLERPVVVFVVEPQAPVLGFADDRDYQDAFPASLMYVGASRACNHLIVLMEKPFLQSARRKPAPR